MSTRLPSPFTILALFLLCVTSYASQPIMTMMPDEAEPGQQRLIWSTDPGIRYELQETSDVSDPESWTTVAGYPSEAEALAQQALIELDAPDRKFYRVVMLDEQPPVIVQRIPGADAFGVRRFSAITVSLSDMSGVDPDSIVLTVGDRGDYTVSSPEVSYGTNTLSFYLGGDIALGDPGTTQEVTLVVSDILGNTGTNTWHFELETVAEIAENVFIFGSPDAQRAGQRLYGASATLAARFGGGPVRMSGSDDDWEIETVTTNTIVLAYISDSAPEFNVGQLLANLAPAHVEHIFYRQIISISDDTGAKRLTLNTTEVTLPDLVVDASFSIGEDAVFLEFDEHGNLMRAIEFEATFQLPSIGADFTGETLFTNQNYTLLLEEGKFLFHPYLKTALHIDFSGVRRFEAQAGGDLEVTCVPRLLFTDSYSTNVSHELWRASHWIWTAVGFVPVGIEISANITAQASLELGATADLKAGFRQYASIGVAGKYERDAPSPVTWGPWVNIDPLEVVPFTYTLNGHGAATLALVPQLDVRVYGVAGLYVNVDPRLELSGSATIVNGTLTEAQWLLGAYADLNAGLSIISFENDELPALPPFRLFTHEWGDSYVSEPEPATPPVITRHPVSQTAQIGNTITFTADATASTAISYQWYHNGIEIPGETGKTLRRTNLTQGHQGSYYVRAAAAGLSANSSSATLSVVTGGGTGPVSGGMVLIPGGTNSGTDPDFGAYSLTVSSFYMDRYPVTKALWDEVYTWAIGNGYSFDRAGSGKGANHPVHTVNWYDVVKWCNARSEKEGRPAVYTVNGAVYRTGRHDNVVQTSAAGYRLPTDVEWEYAARGGLSGRRFPWGDTIQHARANYWSSSSYSYDTSSTRGYHPTYNDGNKPYTSPVGSFAANGYGLYDMAGNVWEWVFDWHPSYVGSSRVNRGGSWNDFAVYCRVGFRYNFWPDFAFNFFGFRVVLPPGQ